MCAQVKACVQGVVYFPGCPVQVTARDYAFFVLIFMCCSCYLSLFIAKNIMAMAIWKRIFLTSRSGEGLDLIINVKQHPKDPFRKDWTNKKRGDIQIVADDIWFGCLIFLQPLTEKKKTGKNWKRDTTDRGGPDVRDNPRCSTQRKNK